MRRKALLVILLVLGAAAWTQTGADGWSRYTNSEAGFSVLMPAQPEESSRTEKGVVLQTFKVIQRPRLYLVIYSYYPDADLKLEISERLRMEKDGFINGLGDGKLISEREFKSKRGSADVPALEFTAETSNAIYKSLVLVDGHRVYFVCTGSVKGNDSTSQFERFLGSFKLD
jgi:hypothetical protein